MGPPLVILRTRSPTRQIGAREIMARIWCHLQGGSTTKSARGGHGAGAGRRPSHDAGCEEGEASCWIPLPAGTLGQTEQTEQSAKSGPTVTTSLWENGAAAAGGARVAAGNQVHLLFSSNQDGTAVVTVPTGTEAETTLESGTVNAGGDLRRGLSRPGQPTGRPTPSRLPSPVLRARRPPNPVGDMSARACSALSAACTAGRSARAPQAGARRRATRSGSRAPSRGSRDTRPPGSRCPARS
jgi:hypothetical protein